MIEITGGTDSTVRRRLTPQIHKRAKDVRAVVALFTRGSLFEPILPAENGLHSVLFHLRSRVTAAKQ